MRRALIRIFAFVFAFAVTSGGIYVYQLFHSMSKLNDRDDSSPLAKFHTQQLSREESEPPKWEGRERVNILLLGGDSRGLKPGEIPRSDTVMVASINPVTKKAHLLSILRDTYVDIPGHGKDRINAAITYGGPNLAMKTVSQLLGIPIQYYVYTDFQGFIAIVDAVGGVDLEVEKDMKYIDKADGPEFYIDLKKGWQHLDGKKALQYVRFRYDAMSDYARTERQRKFLVALAQKMQTTTSIVKLPKIINSIDPYVETNLSVMDMLKLGALAMEAKSEGIAGEQVPPTKLLEERKVNGASVLTADPRKLQAYVRDLFDAADNPGAVGVSPSPSGSPTTKSRPAGQTVGGSARAAKSAPTPAPFAERSS